MVSKCSFGAAFFIEIVSNNTNISGGLFECKDKVDNFWYPKNQWVWIGGSCYFFEASGYMATNKYVDGYWLGADCSWVK